MDSSNLRLEMFDIISKLKFLSNTDHMCSADEMQGALEEINELLNEVFPDVVESDTDILETMVIEIPKGFMNIGISTDNYLFADTNDSVNWDTLRLPLPEGEWSILDVKGKMVTLSRTN